MRWQALAPWRECEDAPSATGGICKAAQIKAGVAPYALTRNIEVRSRPWLPIERGSVPVAAKTKQRRLGKLPMLYRSMTKRHGGARIWQRHVLEALAFHTQGPLKGQAFVTAAYLSRTATIRELEALVGPLL